ncbi:hypothetical protein C0J52_04720 [Blattella germanica]|nr:hypothetical protein C0J52_04720 [Blattella germanica]
MYHERRGGNATGAEDRGRRGNMDTLIFDFDLDFTMLYVQAKYDVSGKILLLPIRGSGPLTGNFSDITVHVKLTAQLEEEKFVKFNGLDITLNVGKGVLKLENLFGGDKVLGDVVNAAINANFAQILKEIGHPLEKALGEALMEISNDAVDGLTLDQISPL